MDEKRIAVIHHSGSGSTKTIGEVFAGLLSRKHQVDIYPVGRSFDFGPLSGYDLLIFGTPTFNCSPSRSMMELVDGMPAIEPPKAAFLYTTYALYTGNCLRILAGGLLEKGVVTSGSAYIRGPASDGSLLFPSISRFFRYEKRTKAKIERGIDEIEMILSNRVTKPKIPTFRWYVPLNYPNQYFGEKNFYRYREQIRIIEDLCTNCNRCVKGCIRGCWTEGEKTPRYSPVDCEFCVRCIHNCPNGAIVFSDRMVGRPRLSGKFYREKKKEILDKF
jgi:ferredoxin